MIFKILDKIREFIENNQMVDVYQLEIVLSKNNDDKVKMRRELALPRGVYPSRRLVAKIYSQEIKHHVAKRQINNAIVVVAITCKIGTFNKKEFESIGTIGKLQGGLK